MIARLSAFVIWALVAVATVFWGMRLFVRADPVPPHAVVASDAVQLRGDLSGLLGAEPVAAVAAAPQMSSRFRLLGVMAAKAGADGLTPGVALISIDGKPARAFTAGARVEDQLVLQNVSLRSASLGAAQGGSSFVLEIPALPAPATGALPKVMIETAVPPPVPVPAAVQRPAGATNPPPGTRPPPPGKINPNTSR
jgi:general secretion pathway protein C